MARRGLLLVAIALLVTLATTQAQAAYVDDMQILLTQGVWYHGANQTFYPSDFSGMNPKAGIIEGLISTADSPNWNYRFAGTVEVTPSTLMPPDQSTGGVAQGQFTGNVDLTIIGDLWSEADPGNLIIDNGTLLEAHMTDPSWILSETPPSQSYNVLRGSATFVPQGGALTTGAGAENVTIGSFVLGYWLNMCTPAVVDFGTTNYSVLQPQIQINAIPEPATLTLLGLGAMLAGLRRRR